LKLVEVFRKIAYEKNATVAQLVIAWVLSRGEDVIPLIGSRKKSHLQDALHALNLNLTQEDLQRIEAAVAKNAVDGTGYPKLEI